MRVRSRSVVQGSLPRTNTFRVCAEPHARLSTNRTCEGGRQLTDSVAFPFGQSKQLRRNNDSVANNFQRCDSTSVHNVLGALLRLDG